jgi:hypothetical protein
VETRVRIPIVGRLAFIESADGKLKLRYMSLELVALLSRALYSCIDRIEMLLQRSWISPELKHPKVSAKARP